jgi:hypothetical protein
MLSLVMFVVEHGDTTDPLVEFIDKADMHIEGASVQSYDLRVDLSDTFDIESLDSLCKVL